MGARIAWAGAFDGALSSLPGAMGALDGLPAADVLVCGGAAVDDVSGDAEKFVAETQGGDRLVVVVVNRAGHADWPETRDRAAMGAWVRWAARHWAPDRVRVNAVECDGAPLADMASLIRAMVRWRSMTGQVVRLGRLNGA